MPGQEGMGSKGRKMLSSSVSRSAKHCPEELALHQTRLPLTSIFQDSAQRRCSGGAEGARGGAVNLAAQCKAPPPHSAILFRANLVPSFPIASSHRIMKSDIVLLLSLSLLSLSRPGISHVAPLRPQ